jgi:hypothetical protein
VPRSDQDDVGAGLKHSGLTPYVIPIYMAHKELHDREVTTRQRQQIQL